MDVARPVTLEIEQGLIVNKKLVWKIMRELGLKGLPGTQERSEEPEAHRHGRGPRPALLRGHQTQRAVVDRHH